MKITSKKSSKKPILITAVLVLLVAGAAATYVYAFNGSILGWNNHNTSDKPSTNLDKPTDEQIKSGNDIKNNNATKPNGTTDTPPVPAEQPGSSKKSVEVIITAANQNNDLLQIRAQISTVTNTGQCTLNLTKSGNTITKTTGAQALANTSTCKGFDIPVSELSPGSWRATLTYENDTLMGTASKTIPIQ